ncbi:MAG: hypothetical protein D3904_09220 [Candidatus Electrothrix sp. EH2]|nr:hypothetical protein [Candidatus Electrothrix sp. EH2]
MNRGKFIRAARQAARYGLVLCSSGNLSCRFNEQLMLISASDSWMSDITEDQIKDYRDVLQRAVFFEFAAAIYFRTNRQPVPIDEQEINILHQARRNGLP